MLSERHETVRQALRRVLQNQELTAHEISAAVGVSEKEVTGHLEALSKTLRSDGQRLTVHPATCEDCGFVFRKRTRLGRPSRCPKCRSEHLLPPRFAIST